MKIFLDAIMFSKEREGGISRLFREVVPLITEIDSGVNFLLYLRQKVRTKHLPESEGITHLYEPSLKPWKWLFHTTKVQDAFLERAYQRAKPDIFQSTFFTIPDSICTPFVITVHDMLDELYLGVENTPLQRQHAQLKSKCIAAADLIFSVSHCTTNDILKFYDIDPKKIVTVHHGVGLQFREIDIEEKKQDFLKKHGLIRPFFLFVGMRSQRKNFIGMLKAYAEFKYKNEMDLVVVGGEEELQPWEFDLIARKALGDHIKHIKWLSDNDLVLAYNSAKAFVYPSLYEGFGLPLLEAMACGTPVIASQTSSIPEVAGEAARYFNPHEVEDIVRAMDDVLDTNTAKTLADRGRERAKEFTWNNTAQKMLGAYKQLL